VFFNFNIVEEVQVGGIGAPAEHTVASGAVVNTITKSGGNSSGLFEVRHTNDGLRPRTSRPSTTRPTLAKGGSVLTKLNDFTVQMGGPAKKDKVFWWFSAQRYAFDQDPVGPLKSRTEVSPRYNAKLTFQLTPSDTLTASMQFDNYNVTGRTGLAGTDSTDNQTLNQTRLRRSGTASTQCLARARSSRQVHGLLGLLLPTPGHDTGAPDLDSGSFYAGGASTTPTAPQSAQRLALEVRAGRWPSQLQVRVEIERSQSKSRPSMDGVLPRLPREPYLAYGYGYLIDGKNRRQSYYAQDTWQVGRLTANLGVRLDHIRGFSPNDDKMVYTPKLGLGPRLGATLDLTGRGTSIMKGFWGRYYEGASFNPWQRATSGYTDYISYEVDSRGGLHEFDRYTFPVYSIDSDIDHLGVDEFNVALEHQLRKNMRLSLTYIQRDYRNFINSVHPTARWSPITIANP
jgi:hypothetical protein